MSNSDDVTNYHDTLCIPRVKRAPTNSGLEALSGFFSIFNVDISFSRIFILIEPLPSSANRKIVVIFV